MYNWHCSSCRVVFVGFPEIGVNVSNGKLNFGEDAMVQIVDKIDSRCVGTRSSIDDCRRGGEDGNRYRHLGKDEGLCRSVEVIVVQKVELHLGGPGIGHNATSCDVRIMTLRVPRG